MRIAREVALYNQGGIQNGIDGAEDRASKVATSFITRVSESEGIKVHNADDLTDYIQINSNGVDMVNDNVSIANFGESARVGKTDSSRFVMGADSLEAYDDNNEKYFGVSASGMTYGSNTAASTSYADSKASAAQSAAISTAAADATSKANEAAKTATNYIEADSTGIKVHNANDSSNYTHIGSDGMDVRVSGDSVASFGASSRIGKVADNTTRTELTPGGMKIYNRVNGSDVELANIGYISSSESPYYTFGLRRSGSTVGQFSVVEGADNTASKTNSHAGGFGTIADGFAQTVIGQYNVSDTTSPFIVGYGTGDNDRRNALQLDNYGRLHLKGDVYSKCNNDSSGGVLLKVLKVSKSSVSSLLTIITNSAITSDMEVINCVLSNPSAQTGDWTVTTSNGSLTISGSISGTTNITLYLAEPST